MKQKPKQRKRKHTTATKPARYKCNDIKEQHHVRNKAGKKYAKLSNLKGTSGYSRRYRWNSRIISSKDVTA